MRTMKLKKMAAVITVIGVAWSASTALAQDSSAANTAPPVVFSASAPQLAYGERQILQLAQAKVSEDTIIAYIKNSGNSYGLNADEIIYLRQQGLSDAVLTTMLSQPRAGVAVATPSNPAPQPVAATASAGQASTVTTAPPVSYVQTVPATTYYYSEPYYYYPSCYYPGYAWYPPVTIGWGWGWGWRGGGYYGGGYRGGWHGGGFAGGHGGGFAGGHGGGHGGGHR
jgi:hypothetical protein